ncbi:unnamed protein product [Effrenium voratum]|nr:unnamed protein product [Effrenium voratum]
MLALPMGQEYLRWSVAELKKHLQAQGVTTSGSKDSLVERLLMLNEPGSPSKPSKKPEEKPKAKAKAKAKALKGKTLKPALKLKAPKALKALKAPKAKAKGKAAKSKRADDVGDLHSPVAPLNGCLKKVPLVEVRQALLGPGPCLQKAMKTSPEKLRKMVDAHEFECEALKAKGLSLQQRLAIRLYTAEECGAERENRAPGHRGQSDFHFA